MPSCQDQVQKVPEVLVRIALKEAPKVPCQVQVHHVQHVLDLHVQVDQGWPYHQVGHHQQESQEAELQG